MSYALPPVVQSDEEKLAKALKAGSRAAIGGAVVAGFLFLVQWWFFSATRVFPDRAVAAWLAAYCLLLVGTVASAVAVKRVRYDRASWPGAVWRLSVLVWFQVAVMVVLAVTAFGLVVTGRVHGNSVSIGLLLIMMVALPGVSGASACQEVVKTLKSLLQGGPAAPVAAARRGPFVGWLAGATAVVLAVVVWILPTRPGEPTGWWPGIELGISNPTFYDFSIPDIAVAVDTNTVLGVNLVTRQVVWQFSGNYVSFSGDAANMAVMVDGALTVIDPTTGQVKMQSQFSADQSVIWAGGSMVLMKTKPQPDGTNLCGATLAEPTKCVWTGSSMVVYSDPRTLLKGDVFGGGRWVNTNRGVLDMATGDPAGFGADAGLGSDTTGPVWYAGSTPDRIFRVSSSSGYRVLTFQPWDTTTDTAISEAVQAGWVDASDSSPTFIAGPSASGGVATGYDWATGKQRWQAETTTQPIYPMFDQFVGDGYLLNRAQPSSSAGSVQVAVDPQTGDNLWQGNPYEKVDGVSGGVMYTDNFYVLTARSADPLGAQKWAIKLPSSSCSVTVLGGQVFCYDRLGTGLRVLKQ